MLKQSLLLSFVFFASTLSLFAEPPKANYRNFDEEAPSGVRDFYRLNHEKQTLEFVLGKKAQYLSLNHREMGIFDALYELSQFVDDSDPDLDLAQIHHAFQTAEAIRKDGHPDWFVLTGFIHDLGKVLSLYGEPQWAVVGDTFPVGCAYSDKIVFANYFHNNPDMHSFFAQEKYGIYKENCGLDNVHMSWGHDEYLYNVVKDYLPDEALYIIRYHSFYAAHREGEYDHLMSDYDREMFEWVKEFSQYDLYSKSKKTLNISELLPYYEALVRKYFPEKLKW